MPDEGVRAFEIFKKVLYMIFVEAKSNVAIILYPLKETLNEIALLVAVGIKIGFYFEV